MAKSGDLHKARDAKNDEFYTQLADVANELKHYKQHFKDKIVFCNCDDPTWSAFWEYFHLNFAKLELKKLVSTHYDKDRPTYKMEYTGGDDDDIDAGITTPLEGNGDFRSQECLDLLDGCDIVVTNPPFSLFREYIKMLVDHGKEFLIIGNNSAINYKEFFPLIKNNKIWLGSLGWNAELYFRTTKENEALLLETKKKGSGYKIIDGNVYARAAVMWYTNMDLPKRHEEMLLWEHYTPSKYPRYDNYDAINVDKVSEIPCDYDGKMGVPISYIDKYNPDQFEIIGLLIDKNCPDEYGFIKGDPTYIDESHKRYMGPVLNGKALYPRLIIRKK